MKIIQIIPITESYQVEMDGGLKVETTVSLYGLSDEGRLYKRVGQMVMDEEAKKHATSSGFFGRMVYKWYPQDENENKIDPQ